MPTQLGATPPRSPQQQQQRAMKPHKSPKSPRTRAADAALQQMEALSTQPEVPDLVTETEASLQQLHAELYEGSVRKDINLTLVKDINTPLMDTDEGVTVMLGGGAAAAETKPQQDDDFSSPAAEMVSYMTIADELGVTTHAAHITNAGSTVTVALPSSLARATHALSSAAGSIAPEEKKSSSGGAGHANRRRSFVVSEPVSSPLVRAMHALSMAEPTPPPRSTLGRTSTSDSFSQRSAVAGTELSVVASAAGDNEPFSTPTTGARTQADRSVRARSPAEDPAAAAAAALVAARLSSRLSSERTPQQLPVPSWGNKSGSSPLDGLASLGLSASSLMDIDTTAGASDDVSLSLGACDSLAALVAEATAAGGNSEDADSTLADLSLGAFVNLPAEEDAPMLHAVLRDTAAGAVTQEEEEESPISDSSEEKVVVSAEAAVEAAAATMAMQRQLQSVEVVVSKLGAAAAAAAATVATTELEAAEEDGLKETREHLTEVWQLAASLQELVGAPRIDQWERALSNADVGGGDGDDGDGDGGGGGGTMLWTLLEVARLSRRLTATAPDGGAASLTADTVGPKP